VQELQRQYYALGRYSAKVVYLWRICLVTGRVLLSIIDEGDTAKIVHINIVGNKDFDQETLTKNFEAEEDRVLESL